MHPTTRRAFLRTAGVATVGGIAGCGGDGGNATPTGGGPTPIPGSAYPAIDEWLTETEVGAADDSYDGTVLDRRGNSTLTVQVGAEGNDGNFAYDPPAIVVDEGTTVRFRWTGEGNPHNVEAEPDDQIGESDYEFSSGDPESGSGVKYTHTMDQQGVALYHCEPHLSLGMKGGIAVE